MVDDDDMFEWIRGGYHLGTLAAGGVMRIQWEEGVSDIYFIIVLQPIVTSSYRTIVLTSGRSTESSHYEPAIRSIAGNF